MILHRYLNIYVGNPAVEEGIGVVRQVTPQEVRKLSLIHGLVIFVLILISANFCSAAYEI